MMQLIHGSAHKIPIPDRSVQVIVTSPPFFGLRKYSGGHDIFWPTVSYAPMPGLPPLRVQGCEEGCSHEWGDELLQREQSGRHRLEWETGGNPAAKVEQGPVSQGAYCIHCHGWRGELGLEPTPEMFVAHLVLCLREWRRVLRDDGTVWCNLGDSYASSGAMNPGGHKGLSAASERADGLKRNPENKAAQNGAIAIVSRAMPSGLKPKDLIGIPWRFAFAAQADGWYLRSAITWCKSAAMPESVRDRPTKATEQIFLLSKNQSYYYDAEAVKESSSLEYATKGRIRNPDKVLGEGFEVRGGLHYQEGSATRNMRDWQIINPEPFPGSHFAVFPSRIPEIAILAGSSARGACSACGAAWKRLVERGGGMTAGDLGIDGNESYSPSISPISGGQGGQARKSKMSGAIHAAWKAEHPDVTTGWAAQCLCCQFCDENHIPENERRMIHATQRPGTREDLAETVEQETMGHSRETSQTSGETQQIQGSMRSMPEGFYGPVNKSEILQRELRGQVDVGERSGEQDDAGWKEQIYAKVGERKNDVCASDRDGTILGQTIAKDGTSASYQRRQERQQDRKSPPDNQLSTQKSSQPIHAIVPYEPVPCVVLDPFSGSGTTGKVAARLGRSYIGVDVSQEYLNEITSQRFGDGIQMELTL